MDHHLLWKGTASARIGIEAMSSLEACARRGAVVKVELSSYGSRDILIGRLGMVIAFNKIRLSNADEFGEAGGLIPFIGKGCAIRRIAEGDMVLYDNGSRIPMNYDERDESKIRALIEESFVQDASGVGKSAMRH